MIIDHMSIWEKLFNPVQREKGQEKAFSEKDHRKTVTVIHSSDMSV